MESIAIVLLLIVLGGGALLVGLIFAIVSGSARSDRLRRLEEEHANLRRALDEAAGRVASLERALGDTMHKVSYLHAEQVAIETHLAEHPPEHPPEEAPRREAPAAATREPPVAPLAVTPEPALAPPPAPAPAAASETPTPATHEAPIPPPLGADATPEAQAPEAAAEPAPAPPAPAPPAAEEQAPVATPPGAGPVVPVWPAPAPAAAPPYAEAARVAYPEQGPAAAAPAAAPPPPSAPIPAPARFDWEHWVGVRGAAALGACVLVIAGLYFFKYSIENDLISPAMRTVLGVLVGLGGLVGSELTLRRSYTVLANWLAGAGVAILYTAFWFAHQLGLVPAVVAFGLMILVTAACGLLATRHDAMVIALLGLAGGFATPVALSSGEDHPFGLFGYLLLLDGAILYLARKRQWPVLGALSLLGTALYQAAWIGVRMGPDRLLLGMGALVVFGGVYAFAAPAARKDESDPWGITRVATVLLPFAFGLYFGVRADLGDRLYPLGLMLCVVSAGAGWIGRARAASWASPVAAVAGTTVVGVWLFVHQAAAIPWEAALVPALLAAVFHGFVELDDLRPRPESRTSAASAAAIACLGTLLCLVVAACAPAASDPWPWLGGWLVLGALAVRQSFFPGYDGIRLGLSLLVSLGIAAVHFTHADLLVFPAERLFLAGLLAVTGLGLLSAAQVARDAPEGQTRSDEVAALLPFLTTLYFAARGEIGPHPTPTGIALTALAAGALWAARARREAGWMAAGAALLGLGTLAVWLAAHAPADVAPEAALVVCGFVGVFAGFVEAAERRGEALSDTFERSAALSCLGGVAVLGGTAASAACVSPWPWLAGWTLLGALALRQYARPGRELWHLPLAGVLGLVFPVVQGTHAGDAAFPAGAVWMAAALVTAVGFLAASLAQREGPAARWAGHGAGTLALVLLLVALTGSQAPAPPGVVLLVTLALAVVAAVVAARLGAGGWSFAAVLATAFAQTSWTLVHVAARAASTEELAVARTALLGQGLAVVVLAGWPLVAGKRLQASTWAWRAAALAGPLWFLSLDHAFRSAFGDGARGLLPVMLGAVTVAVAFRARPLLPDQTRRSALVWLLGVTLAAISLAIPLQLQNEWITVGWALEGAALLLLWRRLDHAGLEYTALAHLSVVAVRLTVNPWVLGYHPRSEVPVFNWLAYTYWLPTLALLVAYFALRDLEVPRRRRWEAGGGRPVFAMSAAAAAIVVFFVWINLTIFDAFGTGRELTVELLRLPARDLTISLAWAIYALFLLGVGMARRSAALRWASLLLIIVTIGKVFLYDLSHLHDLYRVMSLVGLAFSLILISLAYQRFVFGRREEGAR